MMPVFCEVVVAGHICLDIYPALGHQIGTAFDQAFLPGRIVKAGQASFSTGGAVSNTGLALHRLGISTRLAAKVGEDLFGRAVLDLIEAKGSGLASGMLVDPGSHTSYSIIISFPGIDRIFLHYPGANDTFTSKDVPYPLLEKARLFHFGYPPTMERMYCDGGFELESIFRNAKQSGVTTSLDMAFPDPSSEAGQVDWKAILAKTLPWVDIFMPSAEEILYMLRRNIFKNLEARAGGSNILPLITPGVLSDLAGDLIGMGVKIVGFKLGERGLYLRTASRNELENAGRACPDNLADWADQEMWAPCFRVQVAGTTGSGDATIAGFISALLRGLSPRQAVTAAVAVGACNVEAEDAFSGICSWEMTMKRISNGWERHALEIDSPDWTFDPTDRLWINSAAGYRK